MKILYFGMFAQKYSRNRILIKGFRSNGVEVGECNDRSHFIWGLRYLKLLKKFIQMKGYLYDIIFVGFPGQTDVPLAWFLGKVFHKKVVFDAFISLYNSMVFDRKYFEEKSFKASFWKFVDWLSCFLADKIVLDTNEHIKYFIGTFNINKKKFIKVPVGTDTEVFYPRKKNAHKGFRVGFHGSYLPLQGVNIIVGAAEQLSSCKDIDFCLLGNGLERRNIELMIAKIRLSNIKLYDPVPYEDLPKFISTCDIYLGGPFGDNSKSKMVVPNKVYEAMATKTATIVGESMATREFFKDETHCLFVKQGDPKSLSRAILLLKQNRLLRDKISLGGYNLVSTSLTAKEIGRQLIMSLSSL